MTFDTSTLKNTNLAERNKGNVNKWKDIPSPWIEIVNIIKLVILSNQSIDSTQSQSIFQSGPLGGEVEIDKLTLKFIWKCKRLRTTKVIKKKRWKLKDVSDFEADYKPIVIKAVWHWWKQGLSEQWHRVESPEIDI